MYVITCVLLIFFQKGKEYVESIDKRILIWNDLMPTVTCNLID
jgi:hypothetical protein